MRILLLAVAVMIAVIGASVAQEYEKETDKEGDVDYISEPIHEGKDIVIEGYASPVNQVTDEVEDLDEDYRSDVNEDEGLDN